MHLAVMFTNIVTLDLQLRNLTLSFLNYLSIKVRLPATSWALRDRAGLDVIRMKPLSYLTLSRNINHTLTIPLHNLYLHPNYILIYWRSAIQVPSIISSGISFDKFVTEMHQ